MRFKTKAIELEAVKYDGVSIPDFAAEHVVENIERGKLKMETSEGERECVPGDYFVFTDSGQFVVRAGSIFEAIFEPVE